MRPETDAQTTSEGQTPEANPGKSTVRGPDAEGIVSVNTYGRRRGGEVGPYLMIGGIAAVILIGGLMSLNVLKSKLTRPKPGTTSEASVPVDIQFDTQSRPPLPGTLSETATPTDQTQPRCADGSPGHPLRGLSGQVVRNGAGQTVTVCPDGQVLDRRVAQPDAIQPIPVADAPVGPSTRPYVQVGHGARADDGFLMLTEDSAASVHSARNGSSPNDGYPLVQAAVTAEDTAGTTPPASEGLLSAPRGNRLDAELTPSKTPLVLASRLTNLHMMLPRGRSIECGMSVRIISSLAGQVSCVLTQNVYSASGKVVLIERGSEAVGEYRSGASLGQKRLFVLWTRIVTPSGIVINLDSPGADELGSTGLAGKVDNHWWERVGSAFLLSTVQDALQYQTAREQARSGGSTVIFGNTAQAGNNMASRILEKTIDIPPTIYKNQGDRATIYVVRDLDFSSVYHLHAR